MGTSSNPPSPKTPSWDLARAVLGLVGVEALSQSRELWRAAAGERGQALVNELASPLLAAACAIAGRETSPAAAVGEFERQVLTTRQTSLTLDLAKRALARAVGTQAGSQGFASQLFGEVTAYYAARDLPGLVAAERRVPTASAATALRGELRAAAAAVAEAAGPVPTGVRQWRSYVSRVLSALQGREGS
jgi:hypothetical protein